MQIFLLILKVLGILILSILGILILLISLVLFVPVRYQIEGKIDDEFKFRVKGKVSWLLSILTFRFSYMDSEFLQEIRILGFKYQKRNKKDAEEFFDENESEDSLDKETLSQSGATESVASEDDEPEVTYSNKRLERLAEKSKLTEEAQNSQKDTSQDVAEYSEMSVGQQMATSDKENARQNTRKKSWLQKQIDKIKAFFTEMKIKITKLLEILKNGKDKISDIKAVISDETNKRVAALLWKEIRYLLCHFRFRRIDTNFTFGTDDPANTGQLLGVLSLFPILYQYHFHIYPDFEAEKFYLKGDFKIAGRIRLIHVLTSLIRLIREQEVRGVIKNLLEKN